MGRQWLLNRLREYIPLDDRDRARHARLMAFVQAHRNCFDRALTEGHVVASAWVVAKRRDHVLLHHHKRLGRWLQFGGHVDGDKTALEAARRELFEESGLSDAVPVTANIFDLDVHAIPATAKEPEHLHFDVRFAFEADEGRPLVCSGESHALRWVPLDEVSVVAPEASIDRMVRKTAALPRFRTAE